MCYEKHVGRGFFCFLKKGKKMSTLVELCIFCVLFCGAPILYGILRASRIGRKLMQTLATFLFPEMTRGGKRKHNW